MEWYVWLIIGIILISFLIGLIWWDAKTYSAKPEKNNSLPDIPIEERIRLLKYDGLKLSEGTLSRLYFMDSEGCTQRLLLVKYADHFDIIKERLILWDEDELPYYSTYGQWIGDGDGFSHFYDSEETALKEWKQEIERDGYQEEPLPLNL